MRADPCGPPSESRLYQSRRLFAGHVPVVVRGGVEGVVVGPRQGQGPGLIAHPVADEVGIPGIDQDADLVGEHWG